jgi:hypothetical protein
VPQVVLSAAQEAPFEPEKRTFGDVESLQRWASPSSARGACFFRTLQIRKAHPNRGTLMFRLLGPDEL